MKGLIKSLRIVLIAALAFVVPVYARADDLCRNLFDEVWTQNTAISAEGKVVASNGWSISGYISVEPGVTYTWSAKDFSSNLDRYYFFYNDIDSFKSYIHASPYSAISYTITVPAGVKYIRLQEQAVNQVLAGIKNQLEKGSSATSYVPYNSLCATCDGRMFVGQWNQLQNGTKKSAWSSWNGPQNIMDNLENNSVSFDFAGDSSWKIVNNYSTGGTIEGHKYYVSSVFTSTVPINMYLTYVSASGSSTSGFKQQQLTANTTTKISGLVTGTGRGLGFEFKPTQAGSVTVKDYQIFDLTAMFGSGNEPATVAAAESAIKQRAIDLGVKPNADGYYAYNAGEEKSHCIPPIKVATKDYVNTGASADHGFGPVNAALNTVINTIDNLVANTVNQAATIKEIATTRQTRPETGCPAGKQCLLIKNPDGAAQWFEIFDPFHDFFTPIKVKATVSGAEYTYYGNSTGAFGQYTSDSNTLLRWQGNPNWREKYVDGSRSVYTRRWTAATPARTVGGMYETLQYGDETNAGSWAVEYDGTELTGMKAGVVYGIAKCTPQNASRNYSSTTPSSTYEELTEQQKTLWNSVPAKTWTEANAAGETHEDAWSHAPASDAATNFKNCWCKMTALGAPGENGASDGVVYPVSGASWVFSHTRGSAANCAYDCADACAYYVRVGAGFRAAVFNF